MRRFYAKSALIYHADNNYIDFISKHHVKSIETLCWKSCSKCRNAHTNAQKQTHSYICSNSELLQCGCHTQSSG